MPGAYLWGYDSANKEWVRLSVSDKGRIELALPLAEDWVSGWVNNPTAGTVIADTGALAAGYYDVDCFTSTSSSTLVSYQVEHRNAANSANLYVNAQYFRDTAIPPVISLKNHLIGANERIRVTAGVGITGGMFATIIWRRIAT